MEIIDPNNLRMWSEWSDLKCVLSASWECSHLYLQLSAVISLYITSFSVGRLVSLWQQEVCSVWVPIISTMVWFTGNMCSCFSSFIVKNDVFLQKLSTLFTIDASTLSWFSVFYAHLHIRWTCVSTSQWTGWLPTPTSTQMVRSITSATALAKTWVWLIISSRSHLLRKVSFVLDL